MKMLQQIVPTILNFMERNPVLVISIIGMGMAVFALWVALQITNKGMK
ncbi:MAG: hypothetical protein KAJ90_05000 [Desulfobacterales bacterium]|nr:hypothetical protein [Desulfobacterales bacterium]